MTIRFTIGHFLLVVLYENEAIMLNGFRDILIYQDHDLDLSGSLAISYRYSIVTEFVSTATMRYCALNNIRVTMLDFTISRLVT